MGLIGLNPLVSLKFRNVLADFSAKGHVDELVPFTDTQNGLVCFQKKLENFQLTAVPFRFDLSAAVDLFSKQGRIDVGAAGSTRAS